MQMICLATSRQSYDYLVASEFWPPDALWLSSGVLDACELAELRAQGLSVTDFTGAIDANDAVELEVALDTIAEHHPAQAIWVNGSLPG
ncbi:hypothetical protein AO715_07785 [Xanthomonas sp. Mitacek01]|nr:hypothetical protein AO715_07785 [Xanthomonas sp. Mitacek01]